MGTMIHVAAALHLGAASPNFLVCEFHPMLTRLGNDLLVNPIEPAGSYMPLPAGPGVGIGFAEAEFEKVVQARRRVSR
jgi:D-galactarolactone cycloisomerase